MYWLGHPLPIGLKRDSSYTKLPYATGQLPCRNRSLVCSVSFPAPAHAHFSSLDLAVLCLSLFNLDFRVSVSFYRKPPCLALTGMTCTLQSIGERVDVFTGLSSYHEHAISPLICLLLNPSIKSYNFLHIAFAYPLLVFKLDFF